MPEIRIPMVDLTAQRARIKSQIDDAMAGVVDRTDFVRGQDCGAFEKEFAAYCGVRHACGVASGTDALRLALWALGVGPGDEVVTVSHTFIATAEAIVLTGATPVFVEVSPETYTMDPSALERAVTRKTKVILPVHLYGHPCDMDGVLAVAARHGIPVVEDAAQAHGACWRGRRAGSLGRAGCFSFYPGKNLGAYGDAGAVVSDDAELTAHVRQMANHGCGKEKFDHVTAGMNSRLDTLQAAVLRAKLPFLDQWNDERRQRAALYVELLRDAPGIVLPKEASQARSAWHLFVIRVPERARLREGLEKHGISTAVHYPTPLHRQPAMLAAGARFGDLSLTERLAQEVLSLPLYPEIATETLAFIARHVHDLCVTACRCKEVR